MTPPAELFPELCKLAALAAQLPKGMGSDWRNTNHYELSAPHGQTYFWWCLDDLESTRDADVQSTEPGKKLGLLMDIAAEVARLRDIGVIPSTP